MLTPVEGDVEYYDKRVPGDIYHVKYPAYTVKELQFKEDEREETHFYAVNSAVQAAKIKSDHIQVFEKFTQKLTQIDMVQTEE